MYSIYFQHPGGGDLITEYAGRDATKAFDDFGHSHDAKKLLKPLKIGELVEVNLITKEHFFKDFCVKHVIKYITGR